MKYGLEILLTTIISFMVISIVCSIFIKPILNFIIDAFIKRIMKDPYPENLGEMYNVFKKVGIQNVLESDWRGTNGKPLQRPFGTSKHYSQWDKLLLNPVYFSRKPVMESVEIHTKVRIGPYAKRPLEIDLPIMIGGMAYGIGLSLNAKIALSKGADQVKTAANTGVGPCLPEERKHTNKLIIQYHRGFWGKEEEWLRQANAIEIQLGCGALGSAPISIQPQDISPQFKDYMNLKSGEGLSLSATLPNGNTETGFKELVEYLRQLTNGVPIGVKIGASNFLENELEILTKAHLDFICMDGAESGINFGPGILQDDVGLPTLPALCRTVNYLKEKGLRNKISLIISGGLVTPGQVLKAIALGADAVYMGTIILIALVHTETTKVLPWEPPTELIFENGKLKNKLSIDSGSKSVANFLKSCNEEIILAMRALGKTSLKDLTVQDLCALTPEVAQMTGTELGLFPPGSKR